MMPPITITCAPILLSTLGLVGGASAFIGSSGCPSTGGLAVQPRRATLGTRCGAASTPVIFAAKGMHRHRSTSIQQLESALSAGRRRGSLPDDVDDDDDDAVYDDAYIDDLLNEKFDDDDFDDDLDDDDFILDAEGKGSTADDEREYEYARVGRRRGRRADRYEEGSVDGGYGGNDAASSPSRREQRRRRSGSDRDNADEYDGYDAEFDEEDDDYEEDYEEDYDSDDEDEDEDFEEGILIPNPILDSVDPEGTSERIGELFEDPKFWKDMAAVALVVWAVYYLTYDPTDLIPWDSVKPDDFNLQGLYQKS